jgi:predicted negative regulator of RcsB-dependent stress response
MSDKDPAERVRTLLLRGDNLLKHNRSDDKAREAFEEALKVATDAGLDSRLRDLATRRLASMGG